MSRLRIIGDIHAQVDRESLLNEDDSCYLELLEGCEYSVQIGDMGDPEAYDLLIEHVDPKKHRFIPGNHDHYPFIPDHALGDYGLAKIGDNEFFFVRGAESADRQKLIDLGKRLNKQLWFEQEEIEECLHEEVLAKYIDCKPDIVISHTCPASIVPHISRYASSRIRYPSAFQTSLSRTNLLLERLYQAHAPKHWFFGHYHHDWSYIDISTTFQCVGELSYVDI